MAVDSFEIVFRIILAVILGGVVGYERERHNRPAGFRTHILVCVGSTLIMMVSAYGFSGQIGAGFEADPGRIAAGVVTGIGFLGAGTIIQQRGSIRGLTTAASIWVVSGIGLAVGVGFYLGAVLTTVLVLTSLLLLGQIERKIFSRRRLKRLTVNAADRAGLLGHIGLILGDMMMHIRKSEMGDLEYRDDQDAGQITIDFLVEAPMDLNLDELFYKLYSLEGITQIQWEDKTISKHDCRPVQSAN